MARAKIAHKIAIVGGMPVLAAIAIALASWVLLQQADRAHQSAVIAGAVYRELLEAAAARSDYQHVTAERRETHAQRFDRATDEARKQLQLLSDLTDDVQLTTAAMATQQTLEGYAERMAQFKTVTRSNDALIATMSEQAALLIDITESARERQRIANARFSETVVDSDRRLRLHRDILDEARSLRGALAGIWRNEAARLSRSARVGSAEVEPESPVLFARLVVNARSLDDALARAAAAELIGAGVATSNTFAAAVGDLGEKLTAGTDLQDSARALEVRIDQVLNIHGTGYAATQDEVSELTGHAVEANETEQEVQNIAIAVLKLTRRTADAVIQRDTAATEEIIRDSAALEAHMARVPIPPLVQDDMITAMDNWRGSLGKAKQGLRQQEDMIAEMDIDADVMAGGARSLNDVFRSHADSIGRFLRSILVLGATVGLLLAATAAFYVARSITQPLNRLREQMVHLASNPLAAGSISDTERGDEVGAMARAADLFVTEIGEREAALHQAKDQAEEATRAKSSFLAVMSHEIRTPMNGVTAMAEMLDQTDMTDEQHGMIGIIRSSAHALLTIINDILDFSKIEAGKLEFESIPISPAELAEEAVELVTGRAEEKALSIAIDVEQSVPDEVLGDPTRVRQVLINLVGNAIKFTEFGGITVRISRLPGGDTQQARLRFDVVDTGIGLTPAQRARLFQPFQQADSTTSRKFGGTGLGLTICHRLCVMMGGEIGVESEYGSGATFWFELPFQVVKATPQRPLVAIDDVRVLAVGFEGQAVVSLANTLRAGGVAEVEWMDFAADPLPRIAELATQSEQRLAVILGVFGNPDIAMGCARHIIQAPIVPQPAVMLAASRTLVSTLGEADRIGLFCTMTLPLRRRRLWQALAAVVGRADLERRGGAYDRDVTGYSPPSIDEAVEAGCLILVAEDNPINQTVIRRMLGQRGYAIEMADNGAEALALYTPGRYGLLLTDFHMPEMDGFALTRAIRDAEALEGSHLPIVALTADALPGTEQRCVDAGMDGYLTKPIESRLLMAVLDLHLPQAKALRRPAKPKSTSAIPAPKQWHEVDLDPDIFDTHQLAENFSPGDPEAMVFLGDFLALAPKLIRSLNEALESGDSVGENSGARNAAHTLKGASLSIGAARLGQLSADIQDLLDAGDTDMAAIMAGLLETTLTELVDITAEIRTSTPASPVTH
jgi:two-component system, sensor histidine kinase and response regulator